MKVAVLVLVAGCTTGHVKLEPPPSGASFQERLATFRMIAPAFVFVDLIRKCSMDSLGVHCNSHKERSLILGDGRQVKHAADLLPVVAPNSKAAHHARASRRARTWQASVGLGGIALALVGGATLYLSRTDDVHGLEGNETGKVAGIAMIGTGLLGAGIGAWLMHRRAESHNHEAFTYYGADVAEQLGICVEKYELVPCVNIGVGDPFQAPPATPTLSQPDDD